MSESAERIFIGDTVRVMQTDAAVKRGVANKRFRATNVWCARVYGMLDGKAFHWPLSGVMKIDMGVKNDDEENGGKTKPQKKRRG